MSTKMVGLRVPVDDLAEIDRRADAEGLTRTAYMLRAALGTNESLENRMEALEARVSDLESS